MGMSLGTQDFLNDAWPFAKKASWLSTLCTVAPSLILIYGTNGDFLKILSLASYFALYLLVILPSWLVYKKRRMNNSFPLSITGLGCALGLFTFFTKI